MDPTAPVFSSEECVICLDNAVAVTFAPCRHKCSCNTCGTLVMHRKMECPLCRVPITGHLLDEEHLPAADSELERFVPKRNDYLKRLNAPVAKNAGFVGKSKQARAVASHVSNQYEQRVLENAGTNRYANASKAVFTEDNDEAQLRIEYKVDRRVIKETAPLIHNWSDVIEHFAHVIDGDVISEMDLPTLHPDLFWLWKRHKMTTADLNGLVEETKRSRK